MESEAEWSVSSHTFKMWWHQPQCFLQSAISHDTKIPQPPSYKLNVAFPQNSYVEAPAPSAMVLVGTASGRWFGLDEALRVGPPRMGWVSSKEEEASAHSAPREDTVRRQPSANQKMATTKNQTMPAPWPWNSQPPELWGISLVFKPPILCYFVVAAGAAWDNLFVTQRMKPN